MLQALPRTAQALAWRTGVSTGVRRALTRVQTQPNMRPSFPMNPTTRVSGENECFESQVRQLATLTSASTAGGRASDSLWRSPELNAAELPAFVRWLENSPQGYSLLVRSQQIINSTPSLSTFSTLSSHQARSFSTSSFPSSSLSTRVLHQSLPLTVSRRGMAMRQLPGGVGGGFGSTIGSIAVTLLVAYIVFKLVFALLHLAFYIALILGAFWIMRRLGVGRSVFESLWRRATGMFRSKGQEDPFAAFESTLFNKKSLSSWENFGRSLRSGSAAMNMASKAAPTSNPLMQAFQPVIPFLSSFMGRMASWVMSSVERQKAFAEVVGPSIARAVARDPRVRSVLGAVDVESPVIRSFNLEQFSTPSKSSSKISLDMQIFSKDSPTYVSANAKFLSPKDSIQSMDDVNLERLIVRLPTGESIDLTDAVTRGEGSVNPNPRVYDTTYVEIK